MKGLFLIYLVFRDTGRRCLNVQWANFQQCMWGMLFPLTIKIQYLRLRFGTIYSNEVPSIAPPHMTILVKHKSPHAIHQRIATWQINLSLHGMIIFFVNVAVLTPNIDVVKKVDGCRWHIFTSLKNSGWASHWFNLYSKQK